MRFRAVIFDMDGTVANTLPVCFRAIRRTLMLHNGPLLTDAEIVKLFGPSEEGIVQRIVVDDRDARLGTLYRLYREEHTTCTAPFPGMREVLEKLRLAGVKTAIVTGKGITTAGISLEFTGLSDAFDEIEAGSPEGAVKPRQIRRLLEDWGIPPSEAAYVGDSASDMDSAREAGVTPVAAAWAETADVDELRAAEPAALFTDTRELEEWLS